MLSILCSLPNYIYRASLIQLQMHHLTTTSHSLLPQSHQVFPPQVLMDLVVNSRPDWGSQAWTHLFIHSLTTGIIPSNQGSLQVIMASLPELLKPIEHSTSTTNGSLTDSICCSSLPICQHKHYTLLYVPLDSIKYELAYQTHHYLPPPLPPNALLCFEGNPQSCQ